MKTVLHGQNGRYVQSYYRARFAPYIITNCIYVAPVWLIKVCTALTTTLWMILRTYGNACTKIWTNKNKRNYFKHVKHSWKMKYSDVLLPASDRARPENWNASSLASIGLLLSISWQFLVLWHVSTVASCLPDSVEWYSLDRTDPLHKHSCILYTISHCYIQHWVKQEFNFKLRVLVNAFLALSH